MEILLGIVGTILGGILLAFILFLIRDLIFGVTDLSGPWTYTTLTEYASYNPYRNLEITYLALIWIEGNTVHGSAEKIAENSNEGKHEYVGDKRNRINIHGYVFKRYILSDHLVLHLEEQGRKRTSSSIIKLEISKGGKSMEGHFFSTAANSSGKTSWYKGTEGHVFGV